MPSFCRHNHLVQNCPICAREQAVEPRPVVSSSAPGASLPRAPAPGTPRQGRTPGGTRRTSGVRVRRLARGSDDGHRSPLVPGLKSSSDAELLAQELAFAADRLRRLPADPPGLYAEVADPAGELEERIWLAFLIAYLCPLPEGDPFRAIAPVRTAWNAAARRPLEDVDLGPRSPHDRRRASRTIDAYRTWAGRAGSQQAAFTGDPAWTPERRFARLLERMALPGFERDARYELLVSLGALGVLELQAGTLALGGDDEVTVAAKRALGIGDPLLLERRAQALAQKCGIPLAALDLGFYNWERGTRLSMGLDGAVGPDPETLQRVRQALSL